MRVLLLFAMLFCLLGCGPDETKEFKKLNPPFPVNNPEWVKILDNWNGDETWVMRLPQGWLVFRRCNGASGMAFVPDPNSKKETPDAPQGLSPEPQ